MTKWEEKRLGEVAPFIYGKALTAEKRKSGKYKVFSSAGVCGFSDNALAKRGIIIGRKGSVGTVFLSESPFYCIDTAFYIDNVDDCCDMKFLFYYMTLLNLESYNNDAAVPGLNRNLAHKLKIKIPDLPTQQRIADILSAYDDLIENNNKRIALLEKAAQELYKEWFVRFRFPGHETTRFVNGLPEGWTRKKISEFYNTCSGGTPSRSKPEYYENGVYPWVKTGEIKDSIIIDAEEYITENAIRNSSAKLLPAKSVVMAMYGVNIGMLAYFDQEMTCNQACCVFSDKRKFSSRHYLFQYLLSIREYLLLIGFGAAQQNLSQDLIKRVKILMPTDGLVTAFEKKVDDYYESIRNLMMCNQNLTKQRDLLLPRLMSGKLEV
ncbi:MAG: EcoKI restriction-modification system protein HsdS [Firmicutes bacterium ADurb.Bin182]|nr:MAG: EcoKI restriction-modification system protein HsdS [Firmicutes bacterium ADurb.Bin182]